VICVCRLFGMTAGRETVTATFWLLDASDSLSAQSHREPDGTGLGSFAPDGTPVVAKQALAAYEDQAFAKEAREVHSRTFVAHIRFASNGAVALQNTHPFEQAGRLFAHNGVIGDVQRLEQQLGDSRALVQGQTDSERFFALITHHLEDTDDVGSAITAAAGWIAENLPVFALNCILVTPTDLERRAGGPTGEEHLDHRGTPGEIGIHSAHLADHPSVVVASEPMDRDPGWRALNPGELLHVDADLNVSVETVLPDPPVHRLTLADLDPKAAASQQNPQPKQ
jgi:predicted glutamine amidotransferase